MYFIVLSIYVEEISDYLNTLKNRFLLLQMDDFLFKRKQKLWNTLSYNLVSVIFHNVSAFIVISHNTKSPHLKKN